MALPMQRQRQTDTKRHIQITVYVKTISVCVYELKAVPPGK